MTAEELIRMHDEYVYQDDLSRGIHLFQKCICHTTPWGRG